MKYVLGLKEEGINFVMRYLKSKGMKDIKSTDKYCGWDIEATYNGIKYYFEVKNRGGRSFLDGRFNDSICEMHKLEVVPDINHSYLVSLFSDYFSIIPLNSNYEIQEKKCQHTNNWDSNKVMKKIISFKNKDKYKREYPNYFDKSILN